MKEYFDGRKLWGDDFLFEEIKKWYDEEAEGYAELLNYNLNSYEYGYHMMNIIHGFNKIKRQKFENVLGFGSALGYELEPLSTFIGQLTIIEPSDKLVNTRIGNLVPLYVKPSISGSISFADDSFDLITCFGTLHHIPNVSHVLGELIRVLKRDGYLLIREPIISMGDWREPRKGATKNERGIPIAYFEKQFSKYSLEIISREYCFTATSFIQRKIGFMLRQPIYSYKAYVVFDKHLSNLLRKNVRYHALRSINKIAPSSLYYVLKKR